MKSKDVLVSISCITYNHSPYIRQCLDGFLMQRTNFAFEVLIHDDCSTDGTTEIIKEYEAKYPDIIKPIYEEENQYQQGKPSGSAVWNFPRAKGKYIAMCEGDDYWIDPLKLQKQVDVLEADPLCSLVVSNAFDYFMNDNSYRENNPLKCANDGYLSIDELLLEEGNLIPTASMVFRAEYKEMPLLFLEAPVGDRPLRMWCAINGKVYYHAKPMLVHRVGAKSSFAFRINRDSSYAKSIYERMKQFYIQFNKYTKLKYDAIVSKLIDKEEFVYYQRIGDWYSLKNSQYFKSLPFILKTKYYGKYYFLKCLEFIKK